jgi:hypothetical protein
MMALCSRLAKETERKIVVDERKKFQTREIESGFIDVPSLTSRSKA